MPFRIGLLLLPDVTQIDLTGPFAVFIKLPEPAVDQSAARLRPRA